MCRTLLGTPTSTHPHTHRHRTRRSHAGVGQKAEVAPVDWRRLRDARRLRRGTADWRQVWTSLPCGESKAQGRAQRPYDMALEMKVHWGGVIRQHRPFHRPPLSLPKKEGGKCQPNETGPRRSDCACTRSMRIRMRTPCAQELDNVQMAAPTIPHIRMRECTHRHVQACSMWRCPMWGLVLRQWWLGLCVWL